MRLVSETVCGWHVRILLRIPVARILWDFDFLRGLAPGRLDGFSIGRYEKKRESFDLYAAKFENGAMRFWGEKSPGAGTLSKQGWLAAKLRNEDNNIRLISVFIGKKSPKCTQLRQI